MFWIYRRSQGEPSFTNEFRVVLSWPRAGRSWRIFSEYKYILARADSAVLCGLAMHWSRVSRVCRATLLWRHAPAARSAAQEFSRRFHGTSLTQLPDLRRSAIQPREIRPPWHGTHKFVEFSVPIFAIGRRGIGGGLTRNKPLQIRQSNKH